MEATGRGQQVPSLILIHVHPESHPRMQDLVCFILNPGHIIESRKVFAPVSMIPCLILASASLFPLPDLALLAASASLLNNWFTVYSFRYHCQSIIFLVAGASDRILIETDTELMAYSLWVQGGSSSLPLGPRSHYTVLLHSCPLCRLGNRFFKRAEDDMVKDPDVLCEQKGHCWMAGSRGWMLPWWGIVVWLMNEKPLPTKQNTSVRSIEREDILFYELPCFL